jgi:hypothetical protein
LGEPNLAQTLALHDIPAANLTGEYAGLPMHSIDLLGDNLHVNSGDLLAIVLTSNHTYYSPKDYGQYMWNNSFADGIPGGRFYLYSPKVFGPVWFYKWRLDDPTIWIDAGYRITIDAVPEPITAILLSQVSGAMLLSLRKPRRTV